MRIVESRLILILAGICVLASCEQERPARTAEEFVANPIMLEAAMVRCSQDRAATRYEAECINARRAVKEIEAKEEATRKAAFDARSEQKLRELRQSQEAAAAARRQAAELERQREEAEYLAQFGVLPEPGTSTAEGDVQTGNTPQAVISDDGTGGGTAWAVDSEDEGAGNAPLVIIPESVPEQESPATSDETPPAAELGAGSVTEMDIPIDEIDSPSEIEQIRDELQRREAGESDGD